MSFLRSIPPATWPIIGVAAAILSALGDRLPWWAITAACVLTILVLVVQYKTQGNTVISVDVSDWKRVGNEHQLCISPQRHGKGLKPNASVYLPKIDGSYELVEVDISTNKSGDLIIAASSPFEGEVRIS